MVDEVTASSPAQMVQGTRVPRFALEISAAKDAAEVAMAMTSWVVTLSFDVRETGPIGSFYAGDRS
jgi:hypothetical protein